MALESFSAYLARWHILSLKGRDAPIVHLILLLVHLVESTRKGNLVRLPLRQVPHFGLATKSNWLVGEMPSCKDGT